MVAGARSLHSTRPHKFRFQRWLSLALLCFGACAPPPARPAPVSPAAAPHAPVLPAAKGVSRSPSASEAASIRELMDATERLRQLRFRAPVNVRIQDRSAMRAYVESALDETELLRARRRYLALGLLAPELDVRELITSLMEEELVGYYDPAQKLLAIRDDVASSLSHLSKADRELEWRATVVHELVHALQDQHLGLSEAMERVRTTDQENAFGAVVEGDATLAMLAYLAERQGATIDGLVADSAGLAKSLRQSPIALGGRLAAAPAIVREPLLFRYREGALFAAYLYARQGWPGIDDAHRNQPESTIVVNEPPRYLARAKSPRIALPELGSLSAHGCAVADRDVLGSLELGAALASPSLSATELSRSWRGDAYAVLSCDGRDASLWLMRFVSVAVARKARAAFARLPSADVPRLTLQVGPHLIVMRGLSEAAARKLELTLRAWLVDARGPGRDGR